MQKLFLGIKKWHFLIFFLFICNFEFLLQCCFLKFLYYLVLFHSSSLSFKYVYLLLS